MNKIADKQGKPVWQILLSKAQLEVRRAQLLLADIHRRKQQAVDRDEKLDLLLLEYVERLNSIQQQTQSAVEAANYRQFIQQLQSIKQQAKHEIAALEMDCGDARKTLLTADKEHMKLECLAQRAKNKADQAMLSQEAKLAEAQSMAQHNLERHTRRQT